MQKCRINNIYHKQLKYNIYRQPFRRETDVKVSRPHSRSYRVGVRNSTAVSGTDGRKLSSIHLIINSINIPPIQTTFRQFRRFVSEYK